MSRPTIDPSDEPAKQPDSPGPPPAHVILFEPEIAANTGAIGRTCSALGAELWLVRPLGFHLDDRHRRRAGLDYWDTLRLHIVNGLHEAVAACGASQVWYFTTHATQAYTTVPYQMGDALVFGPESRGLPKSVLAGAPGQTVRIPMARAARSLNLSCSVAMGLGEVVRQVAPGYLL